MSSFSLKKERSIIALLCAVQVAHVLDFVILMPLGPILMRELDMSPAQFGLLVSSYHLSAGVSGLFLGALARKFNKKKLLFTLFIIFTIATFLCAFVESYTSFLAIRIFAGAFGGILSSLVYTLVADLIPFERRGKAMGSVLSSFSIASVAGVPLGLAISDISSWRMSFIFIVVISLITSVFVLKILPSLPIKKQNKKGPNELTQLIHTIKNPDYIPGYLFIGIIAFSGFMLFPYLSTYIVHNMKMPETSIKYIYLVGGFCTVFTSRFIGKLTDQFGSLNIFIPISLIGLPCIYLYTHLENVNLFGLVTLASCFMVMMSGRAIPAMTMLTALPPEEDRNNFMSTLNSFRTFVSAIAASFSGYLIYELNGKLVNFGLVGFISISISILGIFLSIYLSKRIRHA